MKKEDVELGSVGSSFDDFLAEQGTLEATNAQAIKRVIAFQIAEAMKERNISKVEMARRLETSRTQLDRLLDPENDGLTIGTLAKAANVLGKELTIELQ